MDWCARKAGCACELKPDCHCFSKSGIKNSFLSFGLRALLTSRSLWSLILSLGSVLSNRLETVTFLTNLRDLLYGSKSMLLEQDKDSAVGCFFYSIPQPISNNL